MIYQASADTLVGACEVSGNKLLPCEAYPYTQVEERHLLVLNRFRTHPQ